MKRILALFLFAASGFGQATNPQNTFANAVGVANPSLWLNFNDSSASSFKDSASGNSFTNIGPPRTPSIGTSCANTASGSYQSSVTCSLDATQGDALVIWTGSQGLPVASLTSSLSGSATLITSNGSYSEWYIANVAAGTHVITATWSGSSPSTFVGVIDVVNAAHGSPVDVYNSSGTNTTSPYTTGSVTTTADNEMIVGMLQMSTAPTYTGPFSQRVLPWSGVSTVAGYYLASSAGTYAFTATGSITSYGGLIVALKTQPNLSGTVITQQPGFDNTNPANYSAKFPYNGFSVAPNNTLGSAVEWNTPWTMLLHVNKLNWNRATTLMLASKGDLNTAAIFNVWWELYLQKNASNGNASQLCFARQSPAPYTATSGVGTAFVASQQWCTPLYQDVMPNGFNYDIAVEGAGTGGPTDLSIWINGLVYPLVQTGQSNGFGGVTIAVSGGTGYANTTAYTSTGGGTNCVVQGTLYASSGVPTLAYSIGSDINAGCTSTPTIVLTAPTGSGVTLTPTTYAMKMNSPTSPLVVAGYVNYGIDYGSGGTDTTQNPLYVDEFAEFPSALSFGQITNIFYETKFYQGLLYAGITANPPLVIFEDTGCGPDFSGDQTTGMVIGAAKAGLIRLLGLDIDDGNPNGSSGLAWYRQMLDQAGLADVPVSWGGPTSPANNIGGCPASTLTAYNASTPQNPASYESATTMYRTLYAKYSTKPIYVLMTQAETGYSLFQLSAADGISSLTGLQLQSQNATNGGFVNAFNGNIDVDPEGLTSVLNHNGTTPILFLGDSPQVGGPGILVSRTVNDPLRVVSVNMGSSETVSGWTNQNLAQIISPYFWGGAYLTYSGGTGYATATPFASTGGGPNCVVKGIMTASGGVPNGIQSSWGTAQPASLTSYGSIGYGCISNPTIVLTAPSGTGVTLTAVVSNVPDNFGGAGTNQFTDYGNAWTLQGSNGPAQIFTWFQNSLMDPPTTGTPRRY